MAEASVTNQSTSVAVSFEYGHDHSINGKNSPPLSPKKSNLLTVHTPETLIAKDTQEVVGNTVKDDDHILKDIFVERRATVSNSCTNTAGKNESLQTQSQDYGDMDYTENSSPEHCESESMEQCDIEKTPKLEQVNFMKNDSGDTLGADSLQTKEPEVDKEANGASLTVSIETVKQNQEMESLCIAHGICGDKTEIIDEHDSPRITDISTLNSKEITSKQPSQQLSPSYASHIQACCESDLNSKYRTETIESMATEGDGVYHTKSDFAHSSHICQDKQSSEYLTTNSAMSESREKLSKRIDELSSKHHKNGSLGPTVKYRNANDEWSCDSESDSDLDSSSSSPSDISDSENASALSRTKKPQMGNFKKDDPLKNSDKTKGEIGLEDLPPIEDLHITVSENEIEQIGNIKNVVGQLVVVQAFRNSSALDLDTVLFLPGGSPLGQIFDVFGPVVEPLYAVRFNSEQDIKDKGVANDTPVYCAPSHSDITCFVFTEKLKSLKGSDASWEHNNEPPEDCLDYSDDEEEKMAKQKRRAKQRSRPLDIFKIGQEIKQLKRSPSYTHQNQWNSNYSASHMQETKFVQRPLLRPSSLPFSRPPSAAVNLTPMSWSPCKPSQSPAFSVPPPVLPPSSPALMTSQVLPPHQPPSPFVPLQYQNGFHSSTVMHGSSLSPQSPPPPPPPLVFSLPQPSLSPNPSHHAAPSPAVLPPPALCLTIPPPANCRTVLPPPTTPCHVPPLPSPCHAIPPPPPAPCHSVLPPLSPCPSLPPPIRPYHVPPPSPYIPPPLPPPQNSIPPASPNKSLPFSCHPSVPPCHSSSNQFSFPNQPCPPPALPPPSHSVPSNFASPRRVLLPTPSVTSSHSSHIPQCSNFRK